MQADRLEEHWTPTSIQATYALHRLPLCTTKSHHISIHLPLLNLGWSFALSLAPDRTRINKKILKSAPCNWVLVAFSFRQNNDAQIPWENTSMHAQLSLTWEQLDNGGSSSLYVDEGASHSTSTTNSISLGSISITLTHTPSAELPISTPYTFLPNRITTISLAVTISECPFPNGLFQARPLATSSETEAHRELVKQCGDRVLSRSLTTGKLFDIKFLSFSTRSPSEATWKAFPTYASLSVLEKHVHLPDSKIKDQWTAALAVDDYGHNNSTHVKEIPCPTEYEYELDSDFEDEDYTSEPSVSSPPAGLSAAILKGKQAERNTSGSLSSLELTGTSDQDLVDCQLEEIIQDSGGPSQWSSVGETDCEQTVLVKFAAHRTWRAFLWYCYTGHIEFNGLKSQAMPGVRRQHATNLEDGPPSCSPKSMYRLADLIGNNDLKVKSLQAIKERMTEANVLDETFSLFTSKYPNVRELQLGVLMDHCGSPEVKAAFFKTMLKFSHMSHAAPVLSAFYDKLVA